MKCYPSIMYFVFKTCSDGTLQFNPTTTHYLVKLKLHVKINKFIFAALQSIDTYSNRQSTVPYLLYTMKLPMAVTPIPILHRISSSYNRILDYSALRLYVCAIFVGKVCGRVLSTYTDTLAHTFTKILQSLIACSANKIGIDHRG